MDKMIFDKMRLKQGISAKVINDPDNYPVAESAIWQQEGCSDFVHLFVQGKEQFEELFLPAAAAVEKNGLFWVSYPKGSGTKKFDINRDILWDLLVLKGWHPVAQVALDEKWSAVRLKRNEQDKTYKRPIK